MKESKKYNPNLKNIGRNCIWWKTGCTFPKAEMIGRMSCEGVVDDVCLYLLNGRKPKSLTDEQINTLKLSPPSISNEFLIPPGDIKV